MQAAAPPAALSATAVLAPAVLLPRELHGSAWPCAALACACLLCCSNQARKKDNLTCFLDATRAVQGLKALNLNDTSLGDEGVATIAEAVAAAAPQLEVRPGESSQGH